MVFYEFSYSILKFVYFQNVIFLVFFHTNFQLIFFTVYTIISIRNFATTPIRILPKGLKTCKNSRDEKRNLRFPCIQWKRKQNFVYVHTVYKGNAHFVFRPWKIQKNHGFLTDFYSILVKNLMFSNLLFIISQPFLNRFWCKIAFWKWHEL